MPNLSEYFQRKLASTITRRVTKWDGTKTYEYVAEVIQVRPVSVVVNLTRRTFSPAGPAYAGEDRYLGDMLIPLSPISGLDDFWKSLISVADPDTVGTLVLPEPSELRTPPEMELLEE